ncbi:hypothetical protein [Acinetobacter baumannii]|uniref:hypothetical protein n=1 Tax=Acinetobacter baumannii TaxID=470 RepID=UPI0011133051|nr:hypothetical protein [Acinetobacter baumannii]
MRKITSQQVKIAMIRVAEETGRPHFEMCTVRDVCEAILNKTHHPLKMLVLQEIFCLYGKQFENEEYREFKDQEIKEKLKTIKNFYGGQKVLVAISGIGSTTITEIMKIEKPLSERLKNRIEPYLDEVIETLELNQKNAEINSHGKYNTYRSGCRCQECRNSWRLYIQARTQKKKDEQKKMLI